MRTLVTALAAARLSRFVTSDKLGDWLIVQPAQEWAEVTDPEAYPENWKQKLVSGLECPFCVGFWIGAGVLAAESLTKNTALEQPYKFITNALALNYVVGHISSRLD